MYALLGLLNLLMPKERTSHRVARHVRYGAHPRQQMDIFAPRGGSRPWPVIYFVYGGSWNMGERGYYEFAGRALAAAGFVVVIADYRLVPEVEYPTFLDDCAAGFAHVVTHVAEYGGDPSRIALMGHSAGAYSAVMLILAERYLRAMGFADRVKAVVGLSGPYDFYPFDVDVSIRAFGATADPKATQPVNLVRGDLPPMFLATGDIDTLVYPHNTVALAAKLRSSGNSVVETHYKGIGHPGTLLALGAFGRRSATVLTDTVAFLKAHL